MDKILALSFILFIQPVVGFLLWFSMNKLFTKFGLEGSKLLIVSIVAAAVLYAVFCFFFARGFLNSPEAKNLGF